MEPRIVDYRALKLVGVSMEMSFVTDKTGLLWRSFMPRRGEIKNRLNDELISMQVYSADFDFQNLNFHKTFIKYAAAEVSGFELVPNGMETFVIPEGKYAVFIHLGAALTAERTYRYIFGEWLPASDYELDNRPHFEVLGTKYKNNDLESEEEIWIPIRVKK